jgi:acetyl-CoA C-acetyltransferase
VAIGGGAESMSRAPYHAPAMRWGARMGDATMTDILLGTLHDPFNRYHMGVTAENLAEKYEITREQQDEYALESHRRASAAIKAGYFRDQIVGYELKTRKGTTVFAEDEHVRHDAKLEDMSSLRPAFKKDGGTVTAGNASGINDGAAAVVLASGEAVKKYGLTPMARLVSYGHAGVDPAFMGIGPVPATQKALEKSGISLADIGVIESNEAFAAQACAVAKALGFDPAKVNPNGSGISLGHPVGATGAINTVKIVHEMQRIQARYGLVTMCIGGGQGIATVLEAM